MLKDFKDAKIMGI